MKTNYRNIIAASVLAFAGVFSANATENKEGLFSITENTVQTIDSRTEAQLVTRWLADLAEAKATRKVMDNSFGASLETSVSFENELENAFAIIDFRAEAQAMTREIADREETKTTRKVMERNFASPAETLNTFENEAAMTDFRLEAQRITKEIADRQEAIVTQKLMDEAWVASTEESNYEETDFRAEGQLLTHLLADQEEVKVFQKLVSEGKIAETK